MPDLQLIVFLRAPRLGTVKTRLAAGVGPVEALRIHEELVALTLSAVGELPGVTLCFAPADAGTEVARWLRPGWKCVPQADGDLGQRMERACASALAAGAGRVVLIGSDCPYVCAGDVRDAWAALADHDVVLGPATDGGYWLIGLRALHRELFTGIPWSTGDVLDATRRRAQEAGLSVALLRLLSDVDTETDWQQFQRHRGAA